MNLFSRSVRYIDELQKFIEDDHYKLSLKLEPNSPAASSSSSKESVPPSKDPIAELNLSPAKGSLRGLPPPAPRGPFVPGHRKSRSDGGSIFWACGRGGSTEPISWVGAPIASTTSDEKLKLHLLDDSVLEEQQASPQIPKFLPGNETRVWL